MLYKVLVRSIERGCVAAAMQEKLDIFLAGDRITSAEYAKLCGLLTQRNV
ncbi:MAG: hypothetical protein RR475_07960 [Clostridia bacterium]